MLCKVIVLLLLSIGDGLAQRLRFDSYSGKLLSEVDRPLNFDGLGSRSIDTCIKQIQACSPREPRRMDGSCNNMQYPIGGVAATPYIRMLPSNYGPANTLSVRPSDGSPFPSARFVRTQIFEDGYRSSRTLNMLGVQFSGFLAVETTKISATENSVEVKRYCCSDVGALDPECIPIGVPVDDPVYGPLGIQCLNVTRIRAFQDYGCSDRSLDRKQVNFQTTLLDLSILYGVDSQAANLIRTRTGGLLRTEERRGRILPATGTMQCPGNKVELNERVCPMLAERLGAADWRLASLVYAFYLEHNRLVRMLAKLNPCWDDEKLFQVTRTINIGYQQNIAFYEWAPVFFGKQRLLDAGLIHLTDGYVNDYDESLQPGTFVDYIIGLRQLHTLVDGRMEMYSANGTSQGSLRLADYLGRMAPFEYGQAMEGINRGSFRQRAAADDMIADPIVGNDILALLERAGDIFAFDIQRGRDVGLPPYNDYREECGMPRARTFDDFLDVMDLEQVENLQKVYGNVDDVEMYPGMVSERSMPDALVGPTLWCIARRQLEIWRRGDRFWFEGSGQPGSFTLEQLREIRKTSFARLSCDNMHGIVRVQSQPFLRVMPGNEQIPCSELPSLDISHWKDPSCSAHIHNEY